MKRNLNKAKKLSDIINNEYVLVVTEYGMSNVDTSYEDDLYELKEVTPTTIKKLKEDRDTEFVAEEIIRLGAEGEEDEEGKISVYEGFVTSVAKRESVTVYAPEFWE